jgi:FMN phosphatase YigB (HAD superfamily)
VRNLRGTTEIVYLAMMGINNNISTVIIDLGNVVLFFDHRIICRKLSVRYGIDDQVVFQKIFGNAIGRQFDQGRLSPELFTQKCSEALGITLDIMEFKSIWRDIFTENRSAIELIKELRKNFRILLLSNTNVWHIEHIRKNFSVLDLFDELILSFQVGYTKPHRKIFERAIELSYEPWEPSRSIFIDDIDAYVKAGMQMGLCGVHYTSIGQLEYELNRLGLL